MKIWQLRRVMAVCIILIAAFLAYFIIRFALGGSIIIDLSGVDMDNSKVFIDGRPQGFYGYNESSKKMIINDTFGNKIVKVNSAGYKIFEVKQNVIFKGSKYVKVSLVKSDANEEANKLIAESLPKITGVLVRAEYRVDSLTKSRYLAATISENSKEREFVALYNSSKGKWERQPDGLDD